MKAVRFLCPLLASLALCPLVNAQNEAFTDPVGFVSVTVPAQSDAVLAVPLNRAPTFRGVIQSISGDVLTIAGTPNWTTNQFVQSLGTQNDSFGIMIASGHPTSGKEGLVARITANTGNTLTIQLEAGDTLTGVGTVAAPIDPDDSGPLSAQADQIDIVPFWTPASLFTAAPVLGTQLLLMPTALPGINLSAQTTYVYNGTAWRQGPNTVDHTPFGFGQAFIFRNNSANPVTVSMVGSVPMASHRSLVRTLAASQRQDIWLGYSSPIPEKVGSVGLGFAAGDQLLVFDNAAVGKNKAAAQTLVYTGTQWRLGGIDVGATFDLMPGNGYIFRKNSTASPTTFIWKDLPSYLE